MYRVKSKTFFTLLSVTLTLIISGCGGGGSSSGIGESSANFKHSDQAITINNSKHVYQLGKLSTSNIVLNIEGKKDIYIVATSNFFNQDISISSSSNSIENSKLRVLNEPTNSNANIKRAFRYREEVLDLLDKDFSKNAPNRRQISRLERSVDSVALNQEANFCIGMNSTNNSCTQNLRATVKKIVKSVQTPNGVKSLVIWLENGNRGVSQNDINKLADIFLKNGGSNDIYDWVTNMLGAEWGSNAKDANSNLIENSNVIDILLYDMNNGGLAGYFWGKDNFKKIDIGASNEKLMFYINTQLLRANPKETYTTLAHEFQHMIHFYQRAVLKDIHDSTWYDELMSETIEDLVATKIEYMGPRNVNPYNGTAGRAGNRGGRFPNFNRYNTASLINWSNTTRDYSKVSSFGTFLARNYDGAKLLNRLMNTDYTDENAILDATKESNFNSLINKWGCAVLLSDIVGLNNKLEYNFGDYRYTSFGSTTYELGSINFFNYIPQPQFHSSAHLDKSANIYYRAGRGLSGNININLNIPKGADVSIVAK